MKKNILILLLFIGLSGFSQNTSEAAIDSIKPFTFQGYGEIYYSSDSSNPANNEKSNFLYNHKRNNEININLAYAKASFNQNNVRANAALMIGNYSQYNLSAEPNWVEFIFEANQKDTLLFSSTQLIDLKIISQNRLITIFFQIIIRNVSRNKKLITKFSSRNFQKTKKETPVSIIRNISNLHSFISQVLYF